MSNGWANGSSSKWRRTRALVLLRDGYRCQIALRDRCTGTAEHAHHVLGRAVTGDDPAWIVAACAPCNLHLGEPGKSRLPPDPQPRKMTQW